ncbi:hypothetical protein DE4585_03239 [Mycobacteroides salmoniphilum]|uniref:Uncharacterized protein n=1 Tax=Mycobacteroides salmoniphilum TaxID=404941 RepID=A0A4R8S166_9MYCO|nr:hypothetical protein [Mycobacteroides salmoniphilum]TDZ79493.1 hypothetical protein DE4585_03239 [Mycobacteroides salmoniphilum]TDZ81569.1 hypothetical protein DE4586_01526 [Mycobacteroides salmoniphilum]TDZ89069.1 hypothetical protein DE4587_01442 [Mycobacteroides salmoniphilum]
MKPASLIWTMVIAACVLIGLDLVIYMAGPRSGGSTGVLAALLVFNLLLFGGLGIYLRRRR